MHRIDASHRCIVASTHQCTGPRPTEPRFVNVSVNVNVNANVNVYVNINVNVNVINASMHQRINAPMHQRINALSLGLTRPRLMLTR